MSENNGPESAPAQVEQEAPAKKRSWLTRSFLFAAKWTTAGLWAPPYLTVKKVFGTFRSDQSLGSKFKKAAAITLLGGLATTASVGVHGYAGTYGLVVMGDNYWFGKPWSVDHESGRVTSAREVGKWPCQTREVELSKFLGDAGSTSYKATLRNSFGSADDEMWAQILEASKNKAEVVIHADRSHFPKEWFAEETEGWLLPNVLDFSCIQKTDRSITSVEIGKPPVLGR